MLESPASATRSGVRSDAGGGRSSNWGKRAERERRDAASTTDDARPAQGEAADRGALVAVSRINVDLSALTDARFARLAKLLGLGLDFRKLAGVAYRREGQHGRRGKKRSFHEILPREARLNHLLDDHSDPPGKRLITSRKYLDHFSGAKVALCLKPH